MLVRKEESLSSKCNVLLEDWKTTQSNRENYSVRGCNKMEDDRLKKKLIMQRGISDKRHGI